MRHYHNYHNSQYINAREHAISASVLYGGAIGLFAGCFLMLSSFNPLSFIGPWATVLVAFLIGAALGGIVGPLFTGLFRADGALRGGEHFLSNTDPVTGRSVTSKRENVTLTTHPTQSNANAI